MTDYSKEEFQKYLRTKIADNSAKIYASNMVVCIKALQKIPLYKDMDLLKILEDFVSHKKHIKNYLEDEFLKALVDVGSNDAGLYTFMTNYFKHYLAMKKNSRDDKQAPISEEKESDSFTEEEKELLEDLWEFEDAPEKIRFSKKFMMAALKEDTDILEFTSDELKDDKEIALLAVAQNGCTLKYLSDTLKDDKDVVSLALKKNISALEYASDKFKNDKEMLLNLINDANTKNKENIYNHSLEDAKIKLFNPNIFDDQEIIDALCSVTIVPFLSSLSNRLGIEEDYLKILVKYDERISEALKNDFNKRLSYAKDLLESDDLFRNRASRIQETFRYYYPAALFNFDNDFHIHSTEIKDENWLFLSLVKIIEDEMLDPLKEQAESFEDISKLIGMVYKDHDIIDLFNDYHHENAKAEEFAQSLLNYTSDVSVDSIMEVIVRSGEDYDFDEASPDVYEALIEIVKEKVLEDNSQSDSFMIPLMDIGMVDKLGNLDSEFKEVLLDYINNLEDEDVADMYMECVDYLES